jgi:hypothetical protein
MLALIREGLSAQFGASLQMLGGCLDRADPSVWLAPVGRVAFWHVAYHVLFCTDMYLSPGEGAFRPPAFHQEGSNFFGPPPWAPQMKVVIDRPYDKETLADYLGTCRAKARRVLAGETEAALAGPSGFPWLKCSRFEAHLYNLRHLQHHTGQLAAGLRRRSGQGVEWVIAAAL